MKILVCISHVPDTTTKILFNEAGTELQGQNIQYIINPYDELALSKGVDLLAEFPGSTLTVLTVGDSTTDPTIRKALAIGATDAVRIDHKPKDAWQVAKYIATYLESHPFDIILTGRESIDYNGNQVSASLAELLKLPSIELAKSIHINQDKATIAREIEGGQEILEISLPVVISVGEGVAETKIPNMRGIMSARTKPLEVVTLPEVPSRISYIKYETPPQKSAVKLMNEDQINELAEIIMSIAK